MKVLDLGKIHLELRSLDHFFMITGFHGTHVSIGVIFLFIYCYKVFAGHYDEGKKEAGLQR